MSFAKVLLAENATAYDNAVGQLTDKMELIRQALDAYAALGVATEPTTADLPDLWFNPKVFLERMLTGGQPMTLGNGGGPLNVAPGQVYDLLQKPAGAETFLLTMERLRQTRRGDWLGAIPADAYELVGGVLRIKQAELDKVLENSRTYATSQAQKEEWDRLQAVVAALEAVRQNGRFGARFYPLDYLKQALHNQAMQFDDLNPVTANTDYIVRLAQLEG